MESRVGQVSSKLKRCMTSRKGPFVILESSSISPSPLPSTFNLSPRPVSFIDLIFFQKTSFWFWKQGRVIFSFKTLNISLYFLLACMISEVWLNSNLFFSITKVCFPLCLFSIYSFCLSFLSSLNMRYLGVHFRFFFVFSVLWPCWIYNFPSMFNFGKF